MVQEAEQARVLNETLKKSLQNAQVDFLSFGDDAFERAKAQALCIMPDLDVKRTNFFKTMVDGQLVDMEDFSLETEDFKDAVVDNMKPEAQEDNHHKV